MYMAPATTGATLYTIVMIRKAILAIAVAAGMATSCGAARQPESPANQPADTHTPTEFRLGADISGTTADEARGRFTRDANGKVTETTRLMKDYGLNGIRLRVWKNPKDGFSSPEDVLVMARRAHRLGMDIMIDFHYSDWWADSGKQNIPARWEGLTAEQMRDSLSAHTRETLKLLKNDGIPVRWVQVGNETTNGFLWPVAHLPENMKEYAMLTRAGYDAVKEVYPEAEVIVHLDNGFDQSLYDRVFDGLRENGAKWDMIGMSVYPYWAIEGKFRPNANSTIRDAIANIRHLKEKYGTDVMIVETGFDAREPREGKELLARLIADALNGTDGACRGVWYWAPEINANEAYHLGAFADDRPTIIMDAYREAAEKLRTAK